MLPVGEQSSVSWDIFVDEIQRKGHTQFLLKCYFIYFRQTLSIKYCGRDMLSSFEVWFHFPSSNVFSQSTGSYEWLILSVYSSLWPCLNPSILFLLSCWICLMNLSCIRFRCVHRNLHWNRWWSVESPADSTEPCQTRWIHRLSWLYTGGGKLIRLLPPPCSAYKRFNQMFLQFYVIHSPYVLQQTTHVSWNSFVAVNQQIVTD